MVIGLQPLKFPRVYPTCDCCHKNNVTHSIEWTDEEDHMIKQYRVCSVCVTGFKEGDEANFRIVPIERSAAA